MTRIDADLLNWLTTYYGFIRINDIPLYINKEIAQINPKPTAFKLLYAHRRTIPSTLNCKLLAKGYHIRYLCKAIGKKGHYWLLYIPTKHTKPSLSEAIQDLPRRDYYENVL